MNINTLMGIHKNSEPHKNQIQILLDKKKGIQKGLFKFFKRKDLHPQSENKSTEEIFIEEVKQNTKELVGIDNASYSEPEEGVSSD